MAIGITLQIKDEDEKGTSWARCNVPSATAHDDAVAFAKEWAYLVDDVITGRIASVTLNYDVDFAPGALEAVASPGSDLEEGALFTFNTAANVPTEFRLATFNEALMVSGTDDVDVTLPSVAALITGMVDGIDTTPSGGSGTIEPCDTRDSGINALIGASESFKTYRR